MNLHQEKSNKIFYDFFLLRLVFTNYSFTYIQCKYFLKFCSSYIYNLFFFYLLRKKIFKYYSKNAKKFYIDLSVKDFFFKIAYIKNKPFPHLISTFKIKANFYLLKKLKLYQNIKKNNFLFFFNRIITFNQVKPSIQSILFLKNSKIIENSIYNNEIKLTNYGIRLILNNSNIQFLKLLEIFSQKNYLLVHKTNKNIQGFFTIFFLEILITNKNNLYVNLNIITKNNILKLWFGIKKDVRLNAKLIHGFLNKYIYIFWLFHEIKILFFPRFSDKLFYSYNYLYNIKTQSNNLNHKQSVIKFPKNFYIIIESNYRIYVYNNNNSNFLNSILLQFCDLVYNLPNLFVGELTKMSLSRAVKRGINSKCILGFLNKNLHPVCKNIPHTVTNQIRAWGIQYKNTQIIEYLIIFKTFQKRKKILLWNTNFKLRNIKNKINVLRRS